MFRLTVEHTFSAAHRLRISGHKCENLHGHNWRVCVTIEGRELREDGMLMDFHDLKALVGAVVGRLDHAYLNDVPPFDRLNPTTENICRHIGEELAARLPDGLRVHAVQVFETDGNSGAWLPD